MRQRKNRKAPSPALQDRLAALEDMAATKGISVHYDRLEAAGLKLKGGICAVKGEYHIFVDRRKPVVDKIELLQDYLCHPLSHDVPKLEE